MLLWTVFFLELLVHPLAHIESYPSDHAVYVSVVEISYTTSLQEATMQVKLFTDDLEDAIQNQIGQKTKLTRSCEQNLEVMESYLREHLKLEINDTPIAYSISGCENVDIAIWLEFSFTCHKDWHTLEITGDQLMELFPTQSNVFSVEYNDQKKMFRLTNSKKTKFLQFE